MDRRARPLLVPLLLATPLLLGGCDLLGIDTPAKVAERRAAEGQAIGAACRHAGRAIEDCYALNRRADKSAIYAGWREMNDYMRENQIEAVPPQLTPSVAGGEGGERPAGEAARDERPKREPS